MVTLDRLLHHRGPDGSGACWLAGELVTHCRPEDAVAVAEAMLFHRRLAIIDLSDDAHQPFAYGGGRFQLTYNGELYNYLELRRDLQELGHCFRSESDTEVVAAGYAEWGDACVDRFEGMFAFAILDVVRRRIFLARDAFGIKPLYYTLTNSELCFASELPAVLELSGVSRQVNPGRAYAYLRYGISDHGDETLFANVRQLPAGHRLSARIDDPSATMTIDTYWRPTVASSDISFVDAVEDLRELFCGSITRHLRSDVPVGCALSGGVDSSAIVSMVRRLQPNTELHTFSYVARGTPLNEERYSDLVAGRMGTVHHKVSIDPVDVQADIERLIACQGEPFGSSSIYGQYKLFEEVNAQGIKVMLDGQGADELFAGYDVYRGARLAQLLRQGKPLEALSFTRANMSLADRKRFWLYAGPFIGALQRQPVLLRLAGKKPVPDWIDSSWFEQRGVDLAYRRAPSFESGTLLRSALAHDVSTSNLPKLLRFEDRNSMAFSVESRVPFLTAQIADFALRLPDQFLVSDRGETKSVFRAAMRGIVPDEILDRTDKVGFATPEADLALEFRKWALATPGGKNDHPSLFATEGLERLLQPQTGDGSFVPWRVQCFIQWWRQFSVTD